MKRISVSVLQRPILFYKIILSKNTKKVSIKGEVVELLNKTLWFSWKRVERVKKLCYYLSSKNICFSDTNKKEDVYMEKEKYFVVKKKAVPEVLLKVVEAKRLLDAEKVMTVQEAAERVGISRSSFYKYKDDIFPYHENVKGKTITFVIQMDDIPGLLSEVLGTIARYRANILTIHQTIPINGIATLTLSADILPDTGDVDTMTATIEDISGIHYLKILSREW